MKKIQNSSSVRSIHSSYSADSHTLDSHVWKGHRTALEHTPHTVVTAPTALSALISLDLNCKDPSGRREAEARTTREKHPESRWHSLPRRTGGICVRWGMVCTYRQLGRWWDGLCVHHERAASPVCIQVSGDSSMTDGGLAANYPKSSPPTRKDNIRITKRRVFLIDTQSLHTILHKLKMYQQFYLWYKLLTII